MKKILITGANSYIGTSFENYMKKYAGYEIDTVDMQDQNWRDKNFGAYDTIFHVAGIAHSDVGKVSEEIKKKYYEINTDLTVEACKKAKIDGAGQFVFMSSIIVFGSKNEIITHDTVPEPDNFYGDSKLRADIKIHSLQAENFNVVSIRPPMIYGKNSKGNYPKLAGLAKKTPVFPCFKNQRSMLYIGNLCEVIKLIVDNNEKGYFYPQNKEYVNTSDLVKTISEVCEKKLYLTKIFNPLIFLIKRQAVIKKVFGSMVYEKSMSDYKDFSYCVYDFRESIILTEVER